MISSASGVPLAWKLVPLQASERYTALDLVREEYAREVAPYLHGKLKILSADGAFHLNELRAELRQHGILENNHTVSHAKRKESLERAQGHRGARYSIEGYPNWKANGHRELRCACGAGTTSKRIDVNDKGKIVARVEGSCETCGPITITSGNWRYTQDNRFVRCHPQDAPSDRDWSFGNPLTFSDPTSEMYGCARFGHNEGLHGTLSTRFALIRNKRWFRWMAQAEIDTAMTFSVMHALALEQRRRLRETLAADPPTLALAA